MSNPSQPIIPPVGGDPEYPLDRDDDRPLDPDLDDDQIDSAEADVRAATRGTMEGDAGGSP